MIKKFIFSLGYRFEHELVLLTLSFRVLKCQEEIFSQYNIDKKKSKNQKTRNQKGTTT